MAYQVPPVQGQAAPPVAQPAPIPRRQQRFRPAATLNADSTKAIPAFPVSVGLPPMIAYSDGYASVEVPASGLNTVIPSYLNLASRVFLTNQRLVGNDKFLKEQTMYHPAAFDLYCSFLFIYHSLRVRAQVGSLSVAEDTLLSNLRANYKENSLPVPGTIAECLMSITATENPYSWLGNLTATVPDNQQYQGGNHGYILNNDLHMVYPCIPMLVAQIYAHVAHAARPTDANILDFATHVYRLDRQQVQTDDPERFWLQVPHARFPSTLTTRVGQAFYDSVRGRAAAPFLDKFVLDLPVLNTNANAANMTLTSYLGVIDAEGVANRRMQFLHWPVQLANMTGTICKYVSGSRHLNDIPTTGLGALTPIARLMPTVVLEDRDPNVIQAGAPAVVTPATLANYHATSFNATLEIRDPVISDLAVQFAMLSQVNIDITNCVDNTGAQIGRVPNTVQGPFWTYAVCEYGPEAAVANLLISHLPNFVRSNPRHNADD